VAVLNDGFEYRKRLGADAAGIRMIDYLTRCYSGFTPEEWLTRIESGRVLLDGVPSNPDAILRPGRILSWMRPPWEEPEVPMSFAILYQDEHLLGIAKPSGLPTVSGGGRFMEHTLLSLVRKHFPGASPLHRLGRGTSGIVLFAMTPEAASKISQAWSCGKILKVYRALASGCPACDEFEVDTPIGWISPMTMVIVIENILSDVETMVFVMKRMLFVPSTNRFTSLKSETGMSIRILRPVDSFQFC
jgi:23S rRNA pseudouridine1911/1915/1917 synthase